MDGITQELMQELAQGGLSQISEQVGLDQDKTGSLLSTAMPLLVSALANNAAKPEGAQALHQALGNDHDGSVLNDLGGFLGDPQSANGAGILGHVLGSQQGVITQKLAETTGMNTEQIDRLLQIAAPLVMGAVGKESQQQSLDVGGLTDFLGGQRQAAQAANPDLMSMLTGFLDTNKDGSIWDDILRLVSKLFGKK